MGSGSSTLYHHGENSGGDDVDQYLPAEVDLACVRKLAGNVWNTEVSHSFLKLLQGRNAVPRAEFVAWEHFLKHQWDNGKGCKSNRPLDQKSREILDVLMHAAPTQFLEDASSQKMCTEEDLLRHLQSFQSKFDQTDAQTRDNHAPLCFPEGGRFEDGVTVKLSFEEEIPGMVIKYTTDGSDPTDGYKAQTYRRPMLLVTPGVTILRAVLIVRGRNLLLQRGRRECRQVFNIVPMDVQSPTITPDSGFFREEACLKIDAGRQAELLTYTVDNDKEVIVEHTKEEVQLSQPGPHIVQAFASIHGKYSGRLYTSAPACATVTIAGTLYKIPREIIRGCMTITGSTCGMLRKNKQKFMQAVHDSLGLGHSSNCDATSIEDASEGEVDVRYHVEVDYEEKRTGAQLAECVMGNEFVQDLASNLTDVCCSAVQVRSAEVEELQQVLLHLEWSFPPSGQDYLDGSCIIYSQEKFEAVVDYQKVHWKDGTIKHSGDVMTKTTGKHVLKVNLLSIPQTITDLFFILSAYRCGDLSLFPSPTVRLYSPKDPSRQLVQFELSQVGRTQATVMSSISRNVGGQWEMKSWAIPCSGTVRNYDPMKEAIQPAQRRHVTWRRRKDLLMLLLSIQEQEDRCVPVIGHEQFTDALHHIASLVPAALWRIIFQYL